MSWNGVYEDAALNAASVVIEGEGLPYPAMPAPPYRQINAGGWGFSAILLAAAPGYFSGPRPLDWITYVLHKNGVTWMSLVPMEVESQMPHLAAAHGTVVVCGLGLGLMAYAVAAKRSVTRLVVVERDAEVIRMFRDFAAFDTWPQRDKIELVEADAREFRFEGADFLYADIWPYYRMDAMVPDMKRMAANIPAPACGYWGQECDMVDFAAAQGIALDDFDADHIRAFAAAHDLPLIGLEHPLYPDLCRRAAINPALGQRRISISS